MTDLKNLHEHVRHVIVIRVLKVPHLITFQTIYECQKCSHIN